MADDAPAKTDRSLIAAGVLTAGLGFYMMLIGLHVVAPPRGDAPLWIALLAGLAFFLAGCAVLVRAWEGVNDSEQDLPANAPPALRIAYWLSGVVAAASVAGIGTWVAFGPGARHFSFIGPVSGPMNEYLGRAVFGFGTLLTWLAVVLIARATAKKIFGNKQIFGKKPDAA